MLWGVEICKKINCHKNVFNMRNFNIFRIHSSVGLITNSSSELYTFDNSKGFDIIKKLLESKFEEHGLLVGDVIKMWNLSERDDIINFIEQVSGYNEYYIYFNKETDALFYQDDYSWKLDWCERNGFNKNERWDKVGEIYKQNLSVVERVEAIKRMDIEFGYASLTERMEKEWEEYIDDWKENTLPLVAEKLNGCVAIMEKEDNFLQYFDNGVLHDFIMYVLKGKNFHIG